MIIELFNEWYAIVLLIIALYEMFARLLPTRKNFSLYSFVSLILREISKIIETYVPNRKK